MCAPGCTEHMMTELSQRRQRCGAIAAGVASIRPFPSFSTVIDLTHTLSPEFPTFEGEPGVSLKQVKYFGKDGYNLLEWTVQEHSGTHLDAPLHFSEGGASIELIPIEQLLAPLAVIDVIAAAEADADYRLSPDDIIAWEKIHGPLPEGCCVAMNSGWERRLGSPFFTGLDDGGVMHFPGVHEETAHMLLAERVVVGLAVDTLSLDHGPSTGFETHMAWLPAGRWGLENVANLGLAPPVGATVVVGAPKIKGATGGPSRVFALA
jgi:kynurenine formamidase